MRNTATETRTRQDGTLKENRPSEARPRRVRRRWLVNPRLQLRYIGVVVGLQAVALAVIAWAVFVVIWKPLLNDLRWTRMKFGTDQQVFAESVRQVTITTLALFVLFGVICAAVGLVVSHGVAGPLVRLKRAIQDASTDAAGQGRRPGRASGPEGAPQVRLRRSDCLHDLADELNTLLGTVARRERDQRELLERVASVTASLSSALQRGDTVAEDLLEQTQELEGLVLRAAAGPR